MKYLKRYNEHKNLSIFGEEWKKLLPKKLGIITSTGKFELVNGNGKKPTPGDKPDIVVAGVGDEINAYYYQVTFDGPNDVLEDGEPDSMSLDMHLTKNEKGIKILVNILYGEAPVFEFSVESPNKVTVSHYNGVGSLYDPKSSFAFTDESIENLVKFFNSFNNGLKLTPKDFTFLDKDKDSYTFDNAFPNQDEKHLKNSLDSKKVNKIQNESFVESGDDEKWERFKKESDKYKFPVQPSTIVHFYNWMKENYKK